MKYLKNEILSPMETNVFDIAISLGATCQSRYHISRTLWEQYYKGKQTEKFKVQMNRRSNYDYGTYFFDWIISPPESVTKVLREKFSRFLNYEDLRFELMENGIKAVKDLHTGLMYIHCFEGCINGDIDYKSLKQQIFTVKKKYTYLRQKTLSLFAQKIKILFVRFGTITIKEIEELIDIFDNKYKIENYNILYMPWKNRNSFPDDDTYFLEKEKIIYKPINWKPYPGCANSWDRAFENIILQTPSA